MKLGVDEKAGDGGEAASLLAEFGELAVGVSGGGAARGSSTVSVDVARQLLTKFAFPASRWQDEVQKLSGGERRRLQLLTCLASRPNVLVLDEPTNDLDIATLTVLEEYVPLPFAVHAPHLTIEPRLTSTNAVQVPRRFPRRPGCRESRQVVLRSRTGPTAL